MSLCEEPARKIFIKQCATLILDRNSELSRHRKWTLVTKNKPVSVGLVWIQGVIISASELLDTITIDDGSGEAILTSIKDAPGFGSWIQKGQYVMAIGEVLLVTPDIKIKTVKLTHLVEPNAEILWILEVLEFLNFLEST